MRTQLSGILTANAELSRWRALLSGLFICIIILYGRAAYAVDRPVIFVSVVPQKYLLQQIAGDRVITEVLVQPGHNPHSYDPTAQQMAKLTRADMLMISGVPFEQVWLPRIRKLNPQLQIVDTFSSVETASTLDAKSAVSDHHPATEDTARHDHGHNAEHLHDHQGIDPHLWMDPIQAREQAKHMSEALIRAYPENADAFERGYQQLERELTQLDRELHEQLHHYEGRSFMVFHPAWGHFATRYHLEQVAIEYQGKSPSARQLVSLTEKARAENIRVILVQEQFNRKPAERIASTIGARVIQADPLPADLPEALRSLAKQLQESWQ